jgi:hypothetical protein
MSPEGRPVKGTSVQIVAGFAGQACQRTALLFHDLGGHKVDARRTDKGGDEARGRPAVDLHRRADLLDAPAVEHHDAVGQCHGLDLVVGDEDHRCAQLLVELGQLDARARAQRRIEVGKRFVEEEQLRLLHDGAGDGHTLALPARQLPRPAFQQRLDLQALHSLADALLDFLGRHACIAQAEREILAHGHVWVEGVLLENHGHVARPGRQRVDAPAFQVDLAGVNRLEAGNHAQQRRFAAAGGTQEYNELAGMDFERQVVDYTHVAEVLAHSGQSHPCHALPLFLVVGLFSGVMRGCQWCATMRGGT